MAEEGVVEGNKQQRAYVRKETPAVLQTFKALSRGNLQLLVRLVQYSKTEPLIDIREYIRSDDFSGFSKKGLTFTRDQLVQLQEDIPKMIQAMDELS